MQWMIQSHRHHLCAKVCENIINDYAGMTGGNAGAAGSKHNNVSVYACSSPPFSKHTDSHHRQKLDVTVPLNHWPKHGALQEQERREMFSMCAGGGGMSAALPSIFNSFSHLTLYISLLPT